MPKPLTLKISRRKDGRYAKQVDGRYYVWPTMEAARAAVIELARQRQGGNAMAPVPATGPATLKQVADAFRAARMSAVQPLTWNDYDRAIRDFLAAVGKGRTVDSLTPDDFAAARRTWAATLGPWRVDNRVQGVRSMFRWALRVGRLIDREPWYGDAFSKTTAAEKRAVKRERQATDGERPFTPGELAVVLKNAVGPMRAFVLLSLNCGMYAADIGRLKPSDVRRAGDLTVVDDDRHKTGVRRRAPLWPETVEAMAAVRGSREHLFVTARGNPWVTPHNNNNAIALLFGRSLKAWGIKRPGVGFGSLKHTHVSAVADLADVNAARLVRGHAVSGIESHYDYPSLERLLAVTRVARERLLISSGPAPAQPAPAPRH